MSRETDRSFTQAVLVVAVSLGLFGCDTCTLVDCDDRLRITIVQHELEPTALGDYDVLVHFQGGESVNLVCEVTAEGGECHVPGEVDGGAPTGPSGGCAANGQLFVTIRDSSERVTVEVWSGDDLLGEELLEPEYDKNQPNGPDCPPTCYDGEALMLVDSPA